MSTALHHEGIYIAKYIHWGNGAIPTALRGCDIHNGKYIHWNSPTILSRLLIRIFVIENGLIRDINMVNN